MRDQDRGAGARDRYALQVARADGPALASEVGADPAEPSCRRRAERQTGHSRHRLRRLEPTPVSGADNLARASAWSSPASCGVVIGSLWGYAMSPTAITSSHEPVSSSRRLSRSTNSPIAGSTAATSDPETRSEPQHGLGHLARADDRPASRAGTAFIICSPFCPLYFIVRSGTVHPATPIVRSREANGPHDNGAPVGAPMGAWRRRQIDPGRR